MAAGGRRFEGGAVRGAACSLLALPNLPLSRIPQQHIYTSFEQLRGRSITSPFQCFTSLSVQEFFLIPSQNLLWCNLRPFSLVLLNRKRYMYINDSLHVQ